MVKRLILLLVASSLHSLVFANQDEMYCNQKIDYCIKIDEFFCQMMLNANLMMMALDCMTKNISSNLMCGAIILVKMGLIETCLLLSFCQTFRKK